MAGRPRTPDHMKVVKGTYKPSRDNAKRPKTPPAKAGEILPPRHLTAKGKRFFETLENHLRKMKVISAQDAVLLAMIAETFEQYEMCRAVLKKEGLTQKVVTKSGGVMVRVRPEQTIQNELRRQLMSMLMQCGLTPATRAKVNAAGEGEQGDLFGSWMQKVGGDL